MHRAKRLLNHVIMYKFPVILKQFHKKFKNIGAFKVLQEIKEKSVYLLALFKHLFDHWKWNPRYIAIDYCLVQYSQMVVMIPPCNWCYLCVECGGKSTVICFIEDVTFIIC